MADTVRYHESGGNLAIIALGPAVAAVVGGLMWFGGSVQWWILAVFAVVISGFSWLQVSASRVHLTVTITDAELRQGAETIPLRRIAALLPDPDDETVLHARVLGELAAVPRQRGRIGIRLVDGTVNQAWARDVDAFVDALADALADARG